MKTKKIIIIVILLSLVTGCSNSLERAKRSVGLVQDHVTQLIGNISEIQNREFDLQKDFEATIALEKDLSGFKLEDNPLNKNIQARQILLEEMDSSRLKLIELCQDLQEIPAHSQLPKDQIDKVIKSTRQLCDNTETYVDGYLNNLHEEDLTYKSITNKDIDHETFFGVFDNVNTIYTENNMNLDQILGYFESLNALLVNLKVYLVNLTGE